MKKEAKSRLLIVTIYAIAMGFLEAVLVLYLRKIFYQNNFSFPLKGFIESQIFSIELLREAATIIMLFAVSFLAGRSIYEKFAYFIYSFAIWDIFYYIFLKLTLNWPPSLFTWDVLFLIPWPWVGPVLAPILCSLQMIIFASFIIHFDDIKRVKILPKEWAFIIIGSVIILFTWLFDYGLIIFQNNFSQELFIETMKSYVPDSFNWPLFLFGLLLSSIGILNFYIRTKSSRIIKKSRPQKSFMDF